MPNWAGGKQAIKLKGEPSSELNAEIQVAIHLHCKTMLFYSNFCDYTFYVGLYLYYPYTVLRCPKLEFKFLARIFNTYLFCVDMVL